MPFAIILIVLAAGWRIAALHVPALVNFAPLMALTFCGAVYFRDKRLWLVPFAALSLSDLYLDHHYATVYGEEWTWPSVALRLVCFGLALVIGAAVAHRRSWLNLLSGAIGGAIFFYLATNSDAWFRDPAYAKTLAGWWQAMTVGRPEFPPTLYFFRNSLVSDVVFTGIFSLAMESAARRTGDRSLLGRGAEA